MRRSFLTLLLPLAGVAALTTAAVNKPAQFSLFSIQQDIELGARVARQTDSTYRAKGQLLERNSRNARAYQLLDGVVKRVLDNGNLKYRTQFPWSVKIIKDDAVQNAFATPGGYIYVYSGLIKFLDNESELAGILGHEIAHADRRHSTQMLQKQYGTSLLLGIVLGNRSNSQLVQLAAGVGQLKFSRDYELDADKYSTIYLNGTRYYDCDGAAGFFIKAEKQGGGGTPEFLSTHPNPGSRITNIQKSAQALGCASRTVSNTNFAELKRLL
ncbi:M48 family metalloprotease [Hymenobacter sp. APR13]|uniref:M48 family metalloprotease n=1 Tax=Hymenobacter sp. APR13 TaxID=1356852 RepID=UPI0004E0682C|nr:M48 family metalloprotease [Hymenobacter sp. APR13]AII50422.1 hypothetical protein N008_00295 [Hymenobacter sp. APR13]